MVEENKFIYSISFDPLTKLEMKPNDYLFTIKDEIITCREKTINEHILAQLRDIGRNRGCSTLIVIDETKLMDLVHKAEIFDILNKKLDFDSARRYPTDEPMMAIFANKYLQLLEVPVSEELYTFLEKNKIEKR